MARIDAIDSAAEIGFRKRGRGYLFPTSVMRVKGVASIAWRKQTSTMLRMPWVRLLGMEKVAMFRTLTAYGIEVVIVLAILNGIAWLVKHRGYTA